MNTKKTFQIITITLAAAIAASAQTVCSNATLRGDYGVQIVGTRPAASVLSGLQGTPGSTEQVVGVAIQIFDGAGNFTQTDNVKGSLSGITLDRAGTGTYSVNSDCTATYTVNNPGAPPIVNKLVIVDNGAAFVTAVVSPQPVMVTAIGRKLTYLTTCPVNSAPVLSAATDLSGGTNITASGTMVVSGQGFTPSGGNMLSFQRSGYADVVLSETDGAYYWDYSTGQMNAALNSLLAPGTWNLSVHSACSASSSNSLAVTIQ